MVKRVSVLIASIFLLSLSAYAQFTNVTVGSAANNGGGDALRLSFQKLNFTDNYLYGLITNISVSGGADKVATNNGTSYGQILTTPKKLGRVIYAPGYCAADGSTDDTTALATALALVGTDGVLDLGGATYSITTLAFTKSDFKIRNGTLKCRAAIDEFVVGDGSRVTFEDVTIEGNSLACKGATSAARNTDWRFIRCTFQNCYLDNTFYGADQGIAAGFLYRRGMRR
jgi:hypothetical protein